MNKENENASRRLGSKDHYESGDEAMCSMPETTGGNESSPHECEGETEGIFYNYSTAIATFAATFFATIIISIIVSRMWDEDEIKLTVLDYLVRILQAIARLCGSWALECERTYNEYVNALH